MVSSGRERRRGRIWEGGVVSGLMDAARRNSRHWVAVRGCVGERVARAVEPPDSRMALWKGGLAREDGDWR